MSTPADAGGAARPVQRVGVVVAPHRPGASELACRLCDELQARGRECVVDEDARGTCPPGTQFGSIADCAATDLVIVLGGDGTLLAAAREAAPRGTPLLGVDLGSFGFLAAAAPEGLMDHLGALLAGEFAVERRLMLQVETGGGTRLALNDAVVAKAVHGRLIRLHTSLDGDHIATFPADGLVVASATGSTGYSLSAGGPIVDGRMAAMVLTPICPHTLYSRPLLVPADVRIALRLEPDGKGDPKAILFVDGEEKQEVAAGEEIVISRASCEALLVRLEESHFYERLREKLRWGTER